MWKMMSTVLSVVFLVALNAAFSASQTLMPCPPQFFQIFAVRTLPQSPQNGTMTPPAPPAISTPATVPPPTSPPTIVPVRFAAAQPIYTVRPELQQEVINVPTIQNYIQTTHLPVFEKIHYDAYPINDQDLHGCCNPTTYIQNPFSLVTSSYNPYQQRSRYRC